MVINYSFLLWHMSLSSDGEGSFSILVCQSVTSKTPLKCPSA